jgi:hypothetical protein
MTPKEEAKQLREGFDNILGAYQGFLHSMECAELLIQVVQTELNKSPSKDLSDLQYWSEVDYEISLL